VEIRISHGNGTKPGAKSATANPACRIGRRLDCPYCGIHSAHPGNHSGYCCHLYCPQHPDRFTKGIDEYAGLKKGNVAIALMMAGVIVSTAIIMQSGVIGITSAIIWTFF